MPPKKRGKNPNRPRPLRRLSWNRQVEVMTFEKDKPFSGISNFNKHLKDSVFILLHFKKKKKFFLAEFEAFSKCRIFVHFNFLTEDTTQQFYAPLNTSLSPETSDPQFQQQQNQQQQNSPSRVPFSPLPANIGGFGSIGSIGGVSPSFPPPSEPLKSLLEGDDESETSSVFSGSGGIVPPVPVSPVEIVCVCSFFF